MATRAALVVAFAVLLLGTINLFVVIDATSHSASDTLRPFLLTAIPLWAVAIWAARAIIRRSPS